MLSKLALIAVSSFSFAFAQNSLSSISFGGSGADYIKSMAIDAGGNVWVVGTTFSADLPVAKEFQGANKGTQLLSSSDGGLTWNSASSPVPNASQQSPAVMAVDPSNSSTLYVGSGGQVCKSTDSGIHFHCVVLVSSTFQGLTSLAVDPKQPATIYASMTNPGKVFKSADGGQTWADSSSGLPGQEVDSVVIDPFHPNVLFAWTGEAGYVSNDGAGSWQVSSLPWPANTDVPGLHFTFDPQSAGTIYGPGYANTGIFIQKSTDGGKTWTAVKAPFVGCCVIADPKTPGVLYGGEGNLLFWKSVDGGANWSASTIFGNVVGNIAIDPANPQIIEAGQFHSADGGASWSATNITRNLSPVFAASGAAYALAPVTSDAFVAEFRPDGKTLVFSSYFGGTDNDSGNAIAIDGSGNVWIGGSTTSADLPVTAGAFQSTLKGRTNGFVAKISSDGKLLAATYLGGISNDSVIGLAVAPQGNPWFIANWSSDDFPFTTARPPIVPTVPSTSALGELDTSASQVIYATPIPGVLDSGGKSIAMDPSGNVYVTTISQADAKAIVMKVDSSGRQLYQKEFGGSTVPAQMGFGGFLGAPEGPRSQGAALATDADGNLYVAGSTSTSDFPVTAKATQMTIGSGCAYPALEVNTGLIGVIGSVLIDDNFVMKLDPDGNILYSTYIGGSCWDHPTGIAVDSAGNVTIVGETDSGDYPLLSGIEAAPAQPQFASFLSTLNAFGSALTFSSYFYAGSSPSVAASAGAVYFAGTSGTGSQTQPYTGAYFAAPTPVTDGVLSVLHEPPPAGVNLTRIVNGFSLRPGPVAPGEIVTLTIPGFLPSTPTDIGLNVLGPLTTSLQGAQVTFDGTPAYLMSVSYGKVECIVPVEIAGQSSTAVQVNIGGALSNVLNASVSATALGLLSLDGSGTGLAAGRNADGALNGPKNPAKIGTPVTIYLTGAGVTSPSETDGAVPSSTSNVPVALKQSYCAEAYSLPGFVPGLFACSFPTTAFGTPPAQPEPQSVPVQVSANDSQSQELIVYVQN